MLIFFLSLFHLMLYPKQIFMGRDFQIKEIKRIITEWGATTTTKLKLSIVPYLHSTDKTTVQVAEGFNVNDVYAVTYRNGQEVEIDTIPYENLTNETIDEIYNIIEDYDVDMVKTMDRCKG